MTSLSHQKEKLERLKAKLQSQEQKLKLTERKKRTRRLIELGGLIVKAELEALNNNTLLGALLSLKEAISKNDTLVHTWTEQGAKAFEDSARIAGQSADATPLVITFKSEPSRELKSQLRDLNFKWNPFRKEWYGYGDSYALKSFLKPSGGTVERCEE